MNKEQGKEVQDQLNQPLTKYSCNSGNGDYLTIVKTSGLEELILALKAKSGVTKGIVYLEEEKALELIKGLLKACPEKWNIKHSLKSTLLTLNKKDIL